MRSPRAIAIATTIWLLPTSTTPAQATSPRPLWRHYPLGTTRLHHNPGVLATHFTTTLPDGATKTPGLPLWSLTLLIAGAATLALAALARGWTTATLCADPSIPRAAGTKLAFVGIAIAIAIATGFLIPLLT
jgi:hypothetical protein